jgi:hypothetical protein
MSLPSRINPLTGNGSSATNTNCIDETRKAMRIASHDNRLVLLRHGEDGRETGYRR